MPQFPFKPDPSDLPAENFPEVILPDEELPDSSAECVTESKKPQCDKSVEDSSKPRPPIRFKTPAEAIPLEEPRRRSRTRYGTDDVRPSSRSSQSKNFFADDESVSDFRNRFSKPIVAVVGVIWLLGIIYLCKLGLESKPESIAANNENVVAISSEPVTLDEAYQRLSKQLVVAEDLLTMQKNRDSLNRGAALKLKSLYEWNVLDMSRGRLDVERIDELTKSTKQYIGNKDNNINAEARKGLMLLQIREYLKSPDRQFWPEVANQFDELIEVEEANPGGSRNFLILADAVAENGLVDESQQLYKSIHRLFVENKDARLASLAQLAGEKIRAHRPSDQRLAAIGGDTSTANASEKTPEPIAINASDDSTVVPASPLDSDTQLSDSQIPALDQIVDIDLEPSANVDLSDVTENSSDPFAQLTDSATEDGALDIKTAENLSSVAKATEEATPDADVELTAAQGNSAADPFGPNDIDLEITEEDGESILVPTENAPAQVQLATMDPAPQPTTEDDIGAFKSLAPGSIAAAPEPELLSNEIAATEPVPFSKNDIVKEENKSSVSKESPSQMESKINAFLTERAVRESIGQDLVKLDKDQVKSTSFDDVMDADEQSKSESDLEPAPKTQTDDSLVNKEDIRPAITKTVRRQTAATRRTKRASELSGIVRAKLGEYRKRVKSEFLAKNVSTSTLNSAVDFCDYLIENNSIESAKLLLEEVGNAVYLVKDSVERNQVRESYYSSKTRLDYFGRPLVFNGLYDVDGKASGFSESTNELKLFVFWSLDSSISVSLIEQIEKIKEEFNSRRVKVVAVCKTSGQGSLDKLKTTATDNSSITFLQLKAGDRASKQFENRFPVRKYPYLLMLSADNKVVGINIDPVFFDPAGR